MRLNCESHCHRLKAVSGNAFFITAFRTAVVFCAVLLHVLLSESMIMDADGLVAYTVLMLGYLSGEIWNLCTNEGRWNWLNPVILASFFTFVLSFGVSNVIFFMPEEMVTLVGLEPIATPWMNQLMFLVMLGTLAMWLGYDCWVGRKLGQMVQNSRFMKRWMSTSTQFNRPVVCAFLGLSLGARLVMINLGVYGFSSDLDQLIVGATYIQYLTIAESLGQLALLGLALQCFASSRPNLFNRQILLLVLSYEVAFGFLSGFKSQVFMPFIVVGFAYYSQRHRIPRWMIPAVLVGIFAAYAVIEPFRGARYHDASFDGTDVGSIATTMATAGSAGGDDDEGPSTALSVLARVNLTYVASRGIEYAATTRLPENSPNFLGELFLAPVYAFVPRFLWEGKPFQSIGFWYTVEVMGYGLEDGILSSTAMGPVTYLNFAGGPLAILVGFFAIGMLQRMLFDGFQSFGIGGLIIFFGLLRSLVMIDSAVNTMFTSIIRLLPLLIIAQYLLLYGMRSPVGRIADPNIGHRPVHLPS